jgi:hypothetical protein
MIIERFTYIVKVGCRDEFIELTKVAVEEAGLTPRVCSYRQGPRDVVINDLVFETNEARLKFWKDMDWSKPKIAEWLKKEHELRVSGATNALLQVH